MHTEIQVENNLIKEEVDKYNSQVIIKYLDQSEIDKVSQLLISFVILSTSLPAS